MLFKTWFEVMQVMQLVTNSWHTQKFWFYGLEFSAPFMLKKHRWLWKMVHPFSIQSVLMLLHLFLLSSIPDFAITQKAVLYGFCSQEISSLIPPWTHLGNSICYIPHQQSYTPPDQFEFFDAVIHLKLPRSNDKEFGRNQRG